MDTQQQLYGMMALAEEHQKAVKAALEGLAVERAAFAKERAAVAQAVASVAGVAVDVKRAAADAVPALQKAAGSAVSDAVRVSMSEASETAAKALSEAAKPVIGNLSGVVQSAGDVERSLKSAGQWFAWKWVAVAAGGLAGVCLVAYASVAWQAYQVSSLREEKAALQADITQMQATIDALGKKGGHMVIAQCGGRLCIEASSNQGQGAEQWKGANWRNDKTGTGLIIPRGY